MKNAVIIHGMPDKEEYLRANGDLKTIGHWIIWVQEELTKRGILAEVPSMPEPYDPKYDKWKEVFERYQIGSETILIGHSCGGGFLVRYLSENKINVGEVILVAPWMDPTKEFTTRMFDFIIDPNIVSRCESLNIMYSIDDDGGVITTVDELKAVLPQASFIEFTDKGHFTLGDMGTRDFPEILEILNI